MSMTPEEKDTNYENPIASETEEESTIFSAPVSHKDKKKGSNMLRNGIITIAILLCVALVASLLWVFVPKMEEDLTSSAVEVDTTPLWAVNDEDYASVTLTEKNGKIELFSVEVEGDSSTTKTDVLWHIKGVDNTLISTDKTQIVINALTTIEYLRKMEDKEADYGFESPSYKVELKGKKDAKDKTLLIGSQTADSTGVYLKIEGSDTVYLAETGFLNYLNINPLYFADTTGFPAFTKDENYKGEYFTDGALTKFDKIVVEGAALAEKLTFEPNTGVLDFGNYVITSPSHRYANTESVSGLYGAFTGGIEGVGVYSFTNNSSEQKLYGLNKPDFVATIYVDKETRTFKVKKQSDGYYALVGDGLKVILMVSADDLAFASYSLNNFYSNFMFIESLTEVDTITITDGSKTHNFKVITEATTTSDGETENKISSIKANGKVIDTQNFQNYYEHLLWLSAVEFNFIDTSKMTADVKITITHNNGTKNTVIEFYKKSDMRYQMEVNGEEMGVISSSSFKNIFKYAENVANGKTYNS